MAIARPRSIFCPSFTKISAICPSTADWTICSSSTGRAIACALTTVLYLNSALAGIARKTIAMMEIPPQVSHLLTGGNKSSARLEANFCPIAG